MIAKTEVANATGSERASAEAAMLADELRRIAEGDAWHHPSFAELLDGVSAEQAAARPLPAAHSIWELVLHMAAWTDVYRRRLEGEAVEEPEEGDYPPVGEQTAERWAQARASLRAGHQQIVDTVARLGAERLDAKVPGRDYAGRLQVHGAVRHVVYHSGQIGLLRKAG